MFILGVLFISQTIYVYRKKKIMRTFKAKLACYKS